MHILAIECTHISLSVAVMSGNTVRLVSGQEWSRAAETILPLVQQALEESGTPGAMLDAVAVSSGPGSFTALRIGMSAAKGIAFGFGVPLVPVPTLPAMAVAALPFTDAEVIVPVIPSRRDEYYYACYSRTALEDGVPGAESMRGSAGEMLAAAAGAARHSAVVARRTEDFSAISGNAGAGFLDAGFFFAASLLPEAARILGAGIALSPAEAMPDYRQMFVPGTVVSG
jgi:tRNA threonylcarbamoyladenosine biosynthesis protein TsaB